MAWSNELRMLVVSQLENLKTLYGVKEISFQIAQNDEMFPHIVFDTESTKMMGDDRFRHDVKLIIDVYDRGDSAVLVNNLADAVEDELDQKNLPQDGILPTIYLDSRRNLPDEDKKIRHIQIVFNVQNYER